MTVRLVSGQSPKAFADRAEELAHGFGVLSCRIRTAPPGMVVLELVRRDALAAVIPALPIPATSDLRALPVGRCEDGSPFTIRLHGTHLLIAGRPARARAPTSGGWSGRCSRPCWPGWPWCMRVTRS